jgi:hypothetical protein
MVAAHVYDTAHMLSAVTINDLNSKIDFLKQQTGRDITVFTVDDPGGIDAAEADAAQQVRASGVYVIIDRRTDGISYAVKDDPRDLDLRDGILTPEDLNPAPGFAQISAGDTDAGVETTVDAILAAYHRNWEKLRSTRHALDPFDVRLWSILLLIFLALGALYAMSLRRSETPGRL